MSKQDLLTKIERFLARHDMPPTRFGQLAMGDKAFVFRLRDPKRAILDTTIARAEAWMRDFDSTFRADRKARRARRFQTAAAA